MATELSRVWVTESNTIFRRGIAGCLGEAGIAVAGDSPDVPQSQSLRQVDLLIAEVTRSGPAAAAARTAVPGLKLVGIVAQAQPEVLQEALGAGFGGLVLRSELTPDGLVAAVRTVLSGAGSLPLRSLARLLADPGRLPRPASGPGALTSRELAVLRLLSQGRSTREIAVELRYSERTVKNVVHDTLTKLNCRTRTQAVAVLTRQGAL